MASGSVPNSINLREERIQELTDLIAARLPRHGKGVEGRGMSTCRELVGDAYVAMEAIDRARLLATTAAAVPEIASDDARTILAKIGQMMDELHNDIDVMRERLEGAAA